MINIDKINVSYDSKTVLENVSMKVKDGDFIGIIGPNGGGKTTLLKAVLGLVKISSGQIEYKEDIRIGYLPQQSHIDTMFPISVKDVIKSGLMNCNPKTSVQERNAYRERFENLTERMHINNILNKSIGELSGGQMQKAFLCRALISMPEVILLDEPNTYIDKESEFEFYDFIQNDKYVKSILLVSHDIGTISQYVKSYACVNKELHYHDNNKITEDFLNKYGCPIQLVTHGDIPHTVLKHH